jgi:glycosyltransferase involved in cell wall biosynthesis
MGWMLLLLLIDVAILALVIWNTLAWPAPGVSGDSCRETCSILIPARNEEKNLGECLDLAMHQGHSVMEIIVCNDHSEDATEKIVDIYTKTDSKVGMIHAGDLPQGWCGKNFACASLAAEARGDWLLFLDADARLSPDVVCRMIAEARQRECTFLSFWPGLVLESTWERVLMPMLNFVVFTLFPAALSLRRDDPSMGLAHGACMLIQRKEYEATGGHGMVFDKIFEDTGLARAWRAKGLRGFCLNGQDLVRVRMYDSLAGIWQGFQKNVFPAFAGERSFWFFMGFHTLCFLMPFLVLPWFVMGYWRLWPLGAAALCVLLMRAVQARQFLYPYWSMLFHPLAELVLIALGLSSWYHCRSGRGVLWKGRVYGRS